MAYQREHQLLTVLCLALPIIAHHIPIPAANVYRGLRGSYCSQRTGVKCCEGRDDLCVYPILNTVCYCDIFCNRTMFDCCPDFWSYCVHGIQHSPPSRVCEVDGVFHQIGTVIRKNCNKCECMAAKDESGAANEWICSKDACLIRPDIIDAVNSADIGWKAANYSQFWGLTLGDGIKHKLGTFKPRLPVSNMTPLHVDFNDPFPDFFDARNKWGSLVHGVRDQGNCGASWAFSTTAVASDRLAIQTNGRVNIDFSPQHFISCDTRGQMACNGGNVDRAWWFFRKRGVVTTDCYPYSGTRGRCAVHASRERGYCPGKGTYQRRHIYRASPPHRISKYERDIMKEILDRGPVQATFYVKEDFFAYKSGVYRYSGTTKNDPFRYRMGAYHSVRIIGWGTEQRPGKDPLKYWVCANSWGREWGENGYFRIVRGSNECKIESFVLAVWGFEQAHRGRRRRWRGRRKGLARRHRRQ